MISFYNEPDDALDIEETAPPERPMGVLQETRAELVEDMRLVEIDIERMDQGLTPLIPLHRGATKEDLIQLFYELQAMHDSDDAELTATTLWNE